MAMRKRGGQARRGREKAEPQTETVAERLARGDEIAAVQERVSENATVMTGQELIEQGTRLKELEG